jgi:hypothetical protein
MSNFDFKKLREQTKSTGLLLQETFKGTDNQLNGIAQRELNGWKEANDKHNKNQRGKSWVLDAKNNNDAAYLAWKKAHDEGAAKNPDNPEWLGKIQESNRARNNTPEFIEKVKAGLATYVEENSHVIKARNNISNTNPDHIANRREGMKAFYADPVASAAAREARSKAHSKPFKTPEGIFPSLTMAALEYNKIKNNKNGRKWLYSMMKRCPEEYYYITKEQYTKLTGKEI